MMSLPTSSSPSPPLLSLQLVSLFPLLCWTGAHMKDNHCRKLNLVGLMFRSGARSVDSPWCGVGCGAPHSIDSGNFGLPGVAGSCSTGSQRENQGTSSPPWAGWCWQKKGTNLSWSVRFPGGPESWAVSYRRSLYMLLWMTRPVSHAPTRSS